MIRIRISSGGIAACHIPSFTTCPFKPRPTTNPFFSPPPKITDLVDGPEIPHRVGRRAVDDVDDDAAALDMPEEGAAQPCVYTFCDSGPFHCTHTPQQQPVRFVFFSSDFVLLHAPRPPVKQSTKPSAPVTAAHMQPTYIRTQTPVRALQETGDIRNDDPLSAPAHAPHRLVPQAVPIADAW